MEEKVGITNSNAKNFDNVTSLPVIHELDEKNDDIQSFLVHSGTVPQKNFSIKIIMKFSRLNEVLGFTCSEYVAKNLQK